MGTILGVPLRTHPPPALSSAPLWAGLGVGGGVVCRHGYAETCTYGLAPYVSSRSGCGRRAFARAREDRQFFHDSQAFHTFGGLPIDHFNDLQISMIPNGGILNISGDVKQTLMFFM